MARYILMLILMSNLLALSITTALLQDSSSIIYVADINGNRDIYSMAADGTNIQRLTDDPAEESNPVWSPDRQRIAFVSNRTGEFQIFVMDADGSNETRLTQDNRYSSVPSWSPDGQQIAFISTKSRNNDIFIMNSDGSNVTDITVDEFDDTRVVFGPDGHSLFYISVPADGAPSLYRFDLLARTSQPIFDDGDEYDLPVISPDGQRLAYVVTRFDNRGSTAEIYTSDFNGQNSLLITEIENRFVTSLSWSPDGNELVYTVRDLVHKTTQLYVTEINTGGNRTLTNETVVSSDASWSTYEGVVETVESREQTISTISEMTGISYQTARIRSLPDAVDSVIVVELAPGTAIIVVDGPVTGRISATGEQGQWYMVKLAGESEPLGWIWSERFIIRSGVNFQRSLSNTEPEQTMGIDVAYIQSRLIELGYDPGAIDGYYGPMTEAAVIEFQRDNGLTANGIVDQTTWDLLSNP